MGAVPGDPIESRMHAANCRALAASATLETAREAFLNLARMQHLQQKAPLAGGAELRENRDRHTASEMGI
jgi:hypothetical protein